MSDEAKYCPYCGERIYVWYMGGRAKCDECKAQFYVTEADESEREEDTE